MTNIEKIPRELKLMNNWILWKLKNNTKVPVNAQTFKGAMSNNSATWSDFNTAYVALLNHPEYEGLGFMLSDDIVCVDLDNKHDEMTESDFQKLLDDFLKNIPSYCEISHSGKGYHIFVKGKLPKGARRKNNVEIYNDFRYIAITGNIYKDYTEIIEEPEGLIKMYKKYLGEPVKAPKQKVIPQVIHMGNVDCQKVLERAKNDKKFMTLYKGNWKNLNYDSQSEADAAFASLLAFYAEKNLKVMDQIFRSSNLYREKYERKQSGSTYGNIILEQAASFVKEVYQERDSTLVNYDSSVSVKKKYSEYTDTGNAQMFLEKYGNEVLYNFDNKIWNIWTGKKWEEDLKDTVKNKVEKVALEQLEKFGDVKEIKKNARKMLNTAGKNHTLLESQFKRAVINTDYDSYDYLINTQSGIYDLNKNILLDFDRKLKMSKITSCGIDQNPPLLWIKFINEIFQGNEELINYIQKAVGYTLTGSIKEQIVFILYGEGSNGKSVFIDIIQKILNDYSISVPIEVLMDRKHPSNTETTLARIKGARMIHASENSVNDKLNEGLIKQITGGEKVVARFLFGKQFEYYPNYKLWMSTNNKPNIRGTDWGIWRRLVIIPFNLIIPKEKIDKDLINKLEKELPSILNWMIEGYQKYKKEGLDLPDILLKEQNKYRSEMDYMANFILDTIEKKEGYVLKASDVFELYKKWSLKNTNFNRVNSVVFGKEFSKYFAKKRVGGGNVYVNCKVKKDDEDFVIKKFEKRR